MLLFGAPGAGKGTQGKLLGTIPGFHHVSSGDIFRTLDPDSELGRIFTQYSTRGELVPDDVTVRVWREHMMASIAQGRYQPRRDLLVLDGIPRNVNQARLLEQHISVRLIVHLVCPDREKMIERLRRRALKENRADDAREEVIRRRWDVYEQETRPVLSCYPPHLLREVDATGSPGRVLARILQHAVPVQEACFPNPLEY